MADKLFDKTYFIADIAANHDGDLSRAKRLIELAAQSGADAVKFQHFEAKTFVSNAGFESLGGKMSHQSKWNKSVYDVYKDAEVPLSWTEELFNHAKQCGVEFMTTPYSIEVVPMMRNFMSKFKIGSGDITHRQMLSNIIDTNPEVIMLATGASTLKEVETAYRFIRDEHANLPIVLFQCNTNYTGDESNFDYINLNVLKTYQQEFRDNNLYFGLSDHTHGHVTVMGAVALGATVIEKHFTDDTTRTGPDHPFSMTPETWRAMVDDVRRLERSMGDGVKRVEDNERQTVVLQRRAVRLKLGLARGERVGMLDVEYTRPCPPDAITPWKFDEYLDQDDYVYVVANENGLAKGDHLTHDNVIMLPWNGLSMEAFDLGIYDELICKWRNSDTVFPYLRQEERFDHNKCLRHQANFRLKPHAERGLFFVHMRSGTAVGVAGLTSIHTTGRIEYKGQYFREASAEIHTVSGYSYVDPVLSPEAVRMLACEAVGGLRIPLDGSSVYHYPWYMDTKVTRLYIDIWENDDLKRELCMSLGFKKARHSNCDERWEISGRALEKLAGVSKRKWWSSFV